MVILELWVAHQMVYSACEASKQLENKHKVNSTNVIIWSEVPPYKATINDDNNKTAAGVTLGNFKSNFSVHDIPYEHDQGMYDCLLYGTTLLLYAPLFD